MFFFHIAQEIPNVRDYIRRSNFGSVSVGHGVLHSVQFIPERIDYDLRAIRCAVLQS